MATAPDTLVITGPNFQQTAADAMLVTPIGGAQAGLSAALALGNSSAASYYFTGTLAATNQVFFVAPRALTITAIAEVHSVAAGGTSTLTVTKDTGTNAPAAGSAVQTGSFNLNATANTVQTAVLLTDGTQTLAAGDRLSVKWANAVQSSAGVVVTVQFANA